MIDVHFPGHLSFRRIRPSIAFLSKIEFLTIFKLAFIYHPFPPYLRIDGQPQQCHPFLQWAQQVWDKIIWIPLIGLRNLTFTLFLSINYRWTRKEVRLERDEDVEEGLQACCPFSSPLLQNCCNEVSGIFYVRTKLLWIIDGDRWTDWKTRTSFRGGVRRKCEHTKIKRLLAQTYFNNIFFLLQLRQAALQTLPPQHGRVGDVCSA